MRVSIAFRVVAVYLSMSVITLGLAGILTNQAIRGYVMNSTRNTLLEDSHEIISKFKEYSNYYLHHENNLNLSELTVAAQNVNNEYVIVDTYGQILWGTFSAKDFFLLNKIQITLNKVVDGHIESGVYPAVNPVYEYVAVPFIFSTSESIPALRAGMPKIFELPSNGASHSDMKVIIFFARLSDLQRITMQIWLAVSQGLIFASIISMLLGVLLTRRIMKSINVVKNAMERVRKRDFSVIPELKRRDEWGDFVNAFAAMVQSLRAFDEGQKRFLQNASHELKTPLMAIRGYAEGLRDGVFDESETYHALDIVAQESVRLKKIVDDLIYLSKLETLDEVYNFIQFDIVLVIYQIIERIYPLAKEKGIRILPDVAEQVVLVRVDRDKIVQALLNLAANAIRHAKKQIYIRLQENEWVTLIVEDDGDGFHGDDLDRVFERFFHGSKGETGLGLSIAKAIVEKHQGHIYAENIEGGGARFIIRLPFLGKIGSSGAPRMTHN